VDDDGNDIRPDTQILPLWVKAGNGIPDDADADDTDAAREPSA
jgi:hypothetical protein